MVISSLITINDVKLMLDDYYKSKTARAEIEDERTEEIARLLSASEITDAARSAARELLGK